VTNLGTTTLTSISVIDARLAGQVICPSDTLVPGGSMTCFSSEPSEVTTRDLTMGSIVNIATVVGKGPRYDDPTVTATDKVVTFTPSGGDNPVVMTYTSVALLPAIVSRRRLDTTGDDPCGVDAIIAACNQAFSVTTCRCIQHSDGGCRSSSSSSSSSSVPETTAKERLGIAVNEVEEKAGATLEEDSEDITPGSEGGSSGSHTGSPSSSSAETSAEVGVGGRTLEEAEQAVTTELEISFVTDVESTGAMKAAAALDSFADVAQGFRSLLIGDCFEDVLITAVSISQADAPKDKRVPNRDNSSASYLDHAIGTETAVSNTSLDTAGSNPFKWITIFVLATALATGVCVCLGILCVRRSNSGAAAAAAAGGTKVARHRNNSEDNATEHVVVDGSVLDTPKYSQYKKENRMFSSSAATGPTRRGSSRLSAAQKRAAVNARSSPFFGTKAGNSNEDFAVLSSVTGSSFSGLTEHQEEEEEREPGHAQNPTTFQEPGHVPRLSALDFGRTIDEADGERDPVPEFWRRGARGGT
ncbi:unnamed protein product, partial [Laminaria digitata]